MTLLAGDELEEDEELCAQAMPEGADTQACSKPSPTTRLKRNVTTLF